MDLSPVQRVVPYFAPPLNASDLSIRVGLATPKDTCKGMFFNGMLVAVGTLAGESARVRCLAETGERKFVDFFNYPITSFLPAAFSAAESLEGSSGGWESAFRRLGRQAVDDFLATAVGKTLLMLAGSDPRRLLSALPSAFKTCVSYGDRAVTYRSAKECTFVVKRDFMPHPYHEGVLLAVIEHIGVRQVKVEGSRTGVLDADYVISWE
ncbi:MAG: TIGR02265 family protein [Myxococcaceae bacterium]